MSLTREQMLAEMGIAPLWVRREVVDPAAVEAADGSLPAEISEAVPELPQRAGLPDAPLSETPSSVASEAPQALGEDSGRAARLSRLDWPELVAEIKDCRACGLCERRTQAVPGVGDLNADWLFIGEGPGAEEAERGEPFVGQAGRLLDAMLAAINLARGENVYIANAVKCRPPNNRTPEAGEMALCRPFLTRQIALIQPRLIVLLGRAAVQSVLGGDASLASLRGKTLYYRADGLEIPVLVTYHPAYLLRTLPDKAKAWEDLCRARALMGADSGA